MSNINVSIPLSIIASVVITACGAGGVWAVYKDRVNQNGLKIKMVASQVVTLQGVIDVQTETIRNMQEQDRNAQRVYDKVNFISQSLMKVETTTGHLKDDVKEIKTTIERMR